MPKELSLSIDSSGTITAIYDDDLVEVLGEGSAAVARASHVEPAGDEGGWVADMQPAISRFGIQTEGPVVLGPFSLRADALAAEHDWLVEHVIDG